MSYLDKYCAREILRELSGDDFGFDCKRWSEWMRKNRPLVREELGNAWDNIFRKLFPYWAYLDDLHPANISTGFYLVARQQKAVDVLEAISGQHIGSSYDEWAKWIEANRHVFERTRQCYMILRDIEIAKYPYDLLFANASHLKERSDPGFMLAEDAFALLNKLTREDFRQNHDAVFGWIHHNIHLFNDPDYLSIWSQAVQARFDIYQATAPDSHHLPE